MPRSTGFDPNQHLTNALSALDAQIASLQNKRAQLAAIIGGGKASAKTTAKAVGASKAKRPMSEEAKRKISEAQRKRWAAAKKKK
jgi:hypothetical protein